MLGVLLIVLCASSIGATPEFRVTFHNISLTAGGWAHLFCKAYGEKPIAYKWYNPVADEISEDMNQPVYSRTWNSESTLFFHTLRVEDAGSYTCTATNKHGLNSKVFHLNVSPKNKMMPRFQAPIKNVTLGEGQWVMMVCEAEGGRPMSYKWYNQDGEEMTDDDNQLVYVNKFNNDSSLFFKNVSREHEGHYTCSASNNYGQARKVFFLTVAPPNGTKPEFQPSFENVTLTGGRQADLLCQAKGDEPITYKWYNQDEDEITEVDNQSVYVRKWDNASALIFKNLSSEHEGSYKCAASNPYGEDSKMFFLRVISPSDGNGTDNDKINCSSSLFRNAKVLKYTTRSVTFFISLSGPVNYIEVKYRDIRMINFNSRTIRLQPVPEDIYEIGNLIPSALYSFQFSTLPSECEVWSSEYNITLLPDAPEIILEKVHDHSVRLERFWKGDDVLRGTIDKHQIKYFPVEVVNSNDWRPIKNCSLTIDVPSCFRSSYTIGDLKQMVYQIEVRAHTEGGYGEPWRQKVYMP